MQYRKILPINMVKSIAHRIYGRIAYKLALWVVLFSTIITLMITAIQLYLDYRQDLRDIREYFQSISMVQIKTLSQSVWIMDDKQIDAQLNGITKGRDIIYAAVLTEGKPRWFSGNNSAKRSLALDYELLYNHRDVQFNLGSLRVVASLDNLFERLMQRAMIILLANSLKTFLFAGCILFFFQHAVTRHLEKLASHVVNMDFRKKISPLKLDRMGYGGEDEFSQVVNMLNIFQRRGFHAFSALEKSELRLRLFFDATEEGIFGVNFEGRITFANSACLKISGVNNSQDIIDKKVDDVFNYSPSSDLPVEKETRGTFAWNLESGKAQIFEDGLFQVHGGGRFYASVRSYPIVAEGESSGGVFFFTDITEQREVLREKQLLSQAVRQSPLLIIIFDAQGYIQYVNPGFEDATGFSLKEVSGRRPYFLRALGKNRGVFRDIRYNMMSGEKWQGMFVTQSKDGVEHSFDTIVSPAFNSQGKIINLIAICLDVTHQIELQNQLNQAQRMEAVGRLSASFAHEFGNPLLGVRSVIKDISDRVTMGNSDKHLLKLAYAECERMKVLIRDFQQFQRVSSGEKEHHDIHSILDNVLFFYTKHFEKHKIILKKNYDPGLPKIFVSKDQIAQVFLNLIINAVVAMSQDGVVLSISTRVRGEYILVQVDDSGVGISESERELIFEPFFTTKPEVQGTGLGLSISYGIVAGHGGDITFISEAEKGSTFTVHLPLRNLSN